MIWIKRFFPGGALRSFVRSLPFETARHARGDATSWASSDSIRAQRYDFFGERAKNQPFIPFVRPKNSFFSTFEPRFSITFSGSSPDSHCGHTSFIEASTPRRGGKVLSPPPEGAAEAASGGARASSGGTSPRSPPDEGETPHDRQARNPKSQRVGCRGG